MSARPLTLFSARRHASSTRTTSAITARRWASRSRPASVRQGLVTRLVSTGGQASTAAPRPRPGSPRAALADRGTATPSPSFSTLVSRRAPASPAESSSMQQPSYSQPVGVPHLVSGPGRPATDGGALVHQAKGLPGPRGRRVLAERRASTSPNPRRRRRCEPALPRWRPRVRGLGEPRPQRLFERLGGPCRAPARDRPRRRRGTSVAGAQRPLDQSQASGDDDAGRRAAPPLEARRAAAPRLAGTGRQEPRARLGAGTKLTPQVLRQGRRGSGW